jgi:hypothetical protein
MSKQNRANRDRYVQAGRLTPDDMARERMKQARTGSRMPPERVMNRTSTEPRRRAERAPSPRRTGREE